MKIRTFKTVHAPSLDDAVVAAGEMLEHSGKEFGLDFVTATAVDQAALIAVEDVDSQFDAEGMHTWAQIRKRFEDDGYRSWV